MCTRTRTRKIAPMADNPTDDRRSSVRRNATLPFTWRVVEASAPPADVHKALGVPVTVALQGRLAELDEELLRASSGITDPATADALRVVDRKLQLLEECLLGPVPEPPVVPVALSADGVGFDSSEQLPVGTSLGIHLILPVSQHLVCLARVSRCDAAGSQGYRIGAEFVDLDGPTGRRLTRFAISRERNEA